MKRVLQGACGYLNTGPSISPLVLTTCQMVICAACSRLQPRLHVNQNTTGVKTRETSRTAKPTLVIGILMSGALICANYAYVDLPAYFIQISRVEL